MIRVLIAMSVLFFGYSVQAKDVVACGTMQSVLNYELGRFEQADFANKNADSICASNHDPEACKDRISKELESSSKSLADAQASYHEMGCDQPLIFP